MEIFFIGYAFFLGENLGRRYSNYWGSRIWKFGVIELFSENWMRRKFWEPREMKNLYFLQQMVQQKLSGRNYKFQEPTLRRESIVRRENISGESQGDREEFHPEESKRWRRNQQGFFGLTQKLGKIHLSSSYWTEIVQLHVPRKDHILFDWIFFWCHQVNLCRSGGCIRKANLCLLECRREQKFVNIVKRISQDLRHWVKLLWKGFTNLETTSRPDHLWPDALTRIRNAAQRRRKTRINEKRNCYSMQKILSLNMHTGNRCSKLTRAEVSGEKMSCVLVLQEKAQNSV